MSLIPYDHENPPAFPVMVKTPNGTFPEGGMSLRDYFAAHAPEAPTSFKRINITVATGPDGPVEAANETDAERAARWAFSYAAAMMQARKPKTP